MENSMYCPQKIKIKIELLSGSATPHLGIYPKELKSGYHCSNSQDVETNIYWLMTGETKCDKNEMYIKEVLQGRTTRIKIEEILLNEVSQANTYRKTGKYCMIPLIQCI